MLIFHGRFLHSLLPGHLYLGCNSGHRLALLFPLHSWMVLLIWLDTPVFPGALQLESWLPFICKFGLPGSWASLTKADGFLASGPPQWVLGTESCSLKHPSDIGHLGHPPQTCVHNIFFFPDFSCCLSSICMYGMFCLSLPIWHSNSMML